MATLCAGGATTIALSGQTGTIVSWESSVDGGTTWTPIVSTANPLPTGALTQTTQFRAVVQSGTCPSVDSLAATVAVDPTSAGGAATPALATLCAGGATTIALSGQTGTIVSWESSVDGGTTWTPIVSTANPLPATAP